VHCGTTSAPADKRPIIASLVQTDRLDVSDGASAALWGAMAGEPGIVVIGGVGSVSYGEAWDGSTATAGGWGHLFGGEGGGFFMAAEGLRAATLYQDRIGPATLLLERARQHYQRPTLAQIVSDFYAGRITRDQIASFAERVYACAIEGDVRSREIVERTGTALAELVWSVRSALPFPTDAMDVAAVGGMFKLRIVRDTFWRELQGDLPLARLILPRFDPAVGALIGAYKTAGVFRTEVLERLKACLPAPEKPEDA
jgi:N-acetylglucosamine kinase-like BadF-type ATPase